MYATDFVLCALVTFIFSQITVALIHANERAELFIALRSNVVEVFLLGNGGALVEG